MAGRVGQGYVHEFRAEIAGTLKGVLARLGDRAVQPFGHEFTGHAEAYALKVGTGKIGVAVHGARRRRGVALVVPGDDGKHEGGVFHGAGQRAHLIERGTVGDDAVAGYAPVGGFEAHAAAQGCGLADGAAGVRAEGGVTLVRGDAGGRAAAGASGDAFWIAGVAGRAEGGVFRGGAHGELVHVVLADDDRPGCLQAFDHEGVIKRIEAAEDFGTGCGARALGDDGVLDRDGYAPEGLGGVRALRVEGAGLFKSLFTHGDQGMDGWFRLGDAVEAGFGHGFGGDVAPGEARADFGKGGLDQIRHGTLLDDAGHDEELPVGFRGVGENVRMHVFLDRLVGPVGRGVLHRAVQRLDGAGVHFGENIHIRNDVGALFSEFGERAFFGGEAGKSRKVRHAIRGEHEENLSARGWQKEKITIGGHRWSRLTPYDEMTLSYVVLWLRWRRFFSRLAFAPFYEENPHGGIEAQIGLYSY